MHVGFFLGTDVRVDVAFVDDGAAIPKLVVDLPAALGG